MQCNAACVRGADRRPTAPSDLPDEAAAERAAEIFRDLYVQPGEPLFEVERRGPQLFLELLMPRRRNGEPLPPIRHRKRPEINLAFSHHVHEHPTNDQSTAQHQEPGFVLAYSKGRRLDGVSTSIPVTDVAPMVLSWYGIAPQPWMHPAGEPAIRVH